MSRNKKKIPKGNKFIVEKDIKKPCFLIVEMIKNGQTRSKIVPDKKKKENKDFCRDKKEEKD